MKKSFSARAQANFWAGLAIVLPAVLSVGLLLFIFNNVTTITDALLIFLPRELTHRDHGVGTMYWYWSVVAFMVAVLLICLVGMLARNYFGRRIIEWVDSGLLRIPLLNKIYSATKQVNEAISSTNKGAFRTVVLVEFPRAGAYSIGFITSDRPPEVQDKLGQPMVCVFVPTTPNPTAGFLMILPESQVTKLDMSVADGIKYVISLGAISPGQAPAEPNAGS